MLSAQTRSAGDGGSVAKRVGHSLLTLRIILGHHHQNTRTQNRPLSVRPYSVGTHILRDGLLSSFTPFHCASDFVIPRDLSWNHEELLTVFAEIQQLSLEHLLHYTLVEDYHDDDQPKS